MSISKARLLVVDDDHSIRTTLPLILSSAGYKVRSASDGISALEQIRSEVPDILISDLYMPGMSGFDLLSVVRRRYPSIGVIAMSSAFSGVTVPAGVLADIFYEKSSGVPSLLRMVQSMNSSVIELLRPRPLNRPANRPTGGPELVPPPRDHSDS